LTSTTSEDDGLDGVSVLFHDIKSISSSSSRPIGVGAICGPAVGPSAALLGVVELTSFSESGACGVDLLGTDDVNVDLVTRGVGVEIGAAPNGVGEARGEGV
jgi:hypothetical protein